MKIKINYMNRFKVQKQSKAYNKYYNKKNMIRYMSNDKYQNKNDIQVYQNLNFNQYNINNNYLKKNKKKNNNVNVNNNKDDRFKSTDKFINKKSNNCIMPNMNNFEQLNNNFNEVNSKINNNILIQNNNKYDNIIRFPINSNVNYLNNNKNNDNFKDYGGSDDFLIVFNNKNNFINNNCNNNNLNNNNYNNNNFNNNNNNSKINSNNNDLKLENNNNYHKELSIPNNKSTKEKKNNKNNNLEKKYLEVLLKMKENKNFNKVFELSDKRFAILNNDELKIYSLNDFKFITKIDNNGTKSDYIELNNKDIVRKRDSYIDFFKLSDQTYKLFQTIEEGKDDDDYYSFSLHKLMNGNLLSCNNDGIKIYSKENNKYKLILNYKMEARAIDAIEIEDNKLVLFQNKKGYGFQISFFDILSKEEKKLNEGFYCCGLFGNSYLNMFKNNKYLFVQFKSYDLNYDVYNCIDYKPKREYFIKTGFIFNLGKEKYLRCEVDDFPEKDHEVRYNAKARGCLPPSFKIECDFNNDFFIVKKNDKKDDESGLKIFKYDNNKFQLYKNLSLPFNFNHIKGIIKLKNNNFIIYSLNEIFLTKIK